MDAQGRVSLHLRAHSLAEMDEAMMIVRFLEGAASKPHQLWGFSSENADLPILRQRAIALDASTPAFYDLTARRSDEHHLTVSRPAPDRPDCENQPPLDTYPTAYTAT